MEKRLSKDIDFNYYQIWALHYYKKNLYFMSRFRIYEYDIRTGAITLLDDDTDEVCFVEIHFLYHVIHGLPFMR